MQVVQAAAAAVLAALVFAVLILAKNLIIPMVLALFIWFLINSLTDGIRLIELGGRRLPQTLAFALALVVILGVCGLLAQLISQSVNDVVRAAPSYQQNVDALLARVAVALNLEAVPQLAQLTGEIRISRVVQMFAGTVATLLRSTGIVLIYILFLFLEQKYFRPKLHRLCSDAQQQQAVDRILHRIYRDTRTYIGIKTLTSVGTGLVSYTIMYAIGLDFAPFWALLIFLLNYIPTIGSIIATIFPSLFALVQFPTLAPVLGVAIGVTAVQVAVGNILEPRLMGNTLNLSPLVILLSLGLWGSIWGIPGAILCVPLTVMLVIIFSHFEPTRFIAVMLSREGDLR
jgi:predicted PurR-regulated permease PerM